MLDVHVELSRSCRVTNDIKVTPVKSHLLFLDAHRGRKVRKGRALMWRVRLADTRIEGRRAKPKSRKDNSNQESFGSFAKINKSYGYLQIAVTCWKRFQIFKSRIEMSSSFFTELSEPLMRCSSQWARVFAQLVASVVLLVHVQKNKTIYKLNNSYFK